MHKRHSAPQPPRSTEPRDGNRVHHACRPHACSILRSVRWRSYWGTTATCSGVSMEPGRAARTRAIAAAAGRPRATSAPARTVPVRPRPVPQWTAVGRPPARQRSMAATARMSWSSVGAMKSGTGRFRRSSSVRSYPCKAASGWRWNTSRKAASCEGRSVTCWNASLAIVNPPNGVGNAATSPQAAGGHCRSRWSTPHTSMTCSASAIW